MKKLSVSLVALTAILSLSACGGNGSDNKDSVDSAKEVNREVKPVDNSTADFVVKAAAGGTMEVELGKLAAQKASNPRIKKYGEMLVADHSKAGDELKSLAAAQQIAIPATLSDDAKKHADELNKKSGKEFDDAYMDMMLSDHKKDIEAFQKASADLPDSSIKGFATRTLPVLTKHLDSAQAITGKKP